MNCYSQLFRKAYQIAEVLVAMHQVGYMESIGDCYCYRCSITTVDELTQKAKTMEEALKEWTDLVEITRSKYYPLNSFTNKQLCQLRRELCSPNDLKCEGKLLLSALLPCTSDSDITKIIHESRQQLLNSVTTERDQTVGKHSTARDSDISKKVVSASHVNEEVKQALEIKQIVESSALTAS